MRKVRSFIFKWKWLIASGFAVYLVVFYLPSHRYAKKEGMEKVLLNYDNIYTAETAEWKKNVFKFTPKKGPPFFVEELLTDSEIPLKERLTCHADKKAPPRVILSWDTVHGQENLGGCLDWNCIIIHDKKKQKLADAVLIEYTDSSFNRLTNNQYVVYFSQESPVHSRYFVSYPDFFNLTLGFRHDTLAASPYGYTVKLAHRSSGEVINMTIVDGKTKGAAWFVSNCETHSMREKYVKELKKYFPVDVYGACGSSQCGRGGQCEKMLDDDYHFYVAFENSICKDYITEKLWNQGYQWNIVPIVLKRSIVERFAPPHSFIAADDFNSPMEMAAYLHYLMDNKTAYTEFFFWRRQYKVVFLDGQFHDALERPWGFCQICRLLWEKPRPRLSIANFYDWWQESCEPEGTLVNRLISRQYSNVSNIAFPIGRWKNRVK